MPARTPAHLLLRVFLVRLLGLILFGLCGCAAWAQADPPARVGRLNHAEGSVTFSAAGDDEWIDAQANRPLTRGDRLWTDRGSRAELQIGSSAVRLDGQTRLEIMVLDDQAAQLSLTQGTVYVRVRSLPDGENFEIDTPNLAYRAAYPGDYRIDVDATDGTTRVTIHSGTGAVYGEGGHAMPLGGGQQVTFRGRSLSQVSTQESPPQDAFDRWAAERNRHEDQSISARYVPREVVGYQQLDAHGQWRQDATHGAVWFPQGTPANWAPYRNGRWEWIAPWGWTWIDDAPWGFAPFHYGRWALIESRWAWVPGRLGLRPAYAPALVAFVGSSGGLLTSLAGRSGVAWFPLAPGEMWQPGFRASGAYISNVNRNMAPDSSDAHYAYQRRPEALTAISSDDFQRGRPAGAGWLRIAANTLTNAGIVPPPAMPQRIAMAKEPPAQPASPPAQSDVRRVTASTTTGLQVEASQRDREAAKQAAQEQAKATQQARLDQQRKLAEQARLTERAQRAESARAEAVAQTAKHAQRAQRPEAVAHESVSRPEPVKRVVASKRETTVARAEPGKREQAQRAGRDRREQTAGRAELARRPQQAKREQEARRAEVARHAEQRRRDQRLLAKARHDEQLRLASQTRRNEQLRRVAHDQQVEQARRAADRDAQALLAQRTQREAQARRDAEQREQAQRQASQRQQQAATEQLRRDQQAWEQQQQLERARSRPDLRDSLSRPPEVWQRGYPIPNPGRTS